MASGGLPANPFLARIVRGRCVCVPPQVCDGDAHAADADDDERREGREGRAERREQRASQPPATRASAVMSGLRGSLG